MEHQTEIEVLSDCIMNDDWDRAYTITQVIWSRRPNYEEICRMLMLLRDNYEDESTMYGLVHAIERASPDLMYEAIAIKMPELLERAPNWTTRLIARNLAAVEGQQSGHSATRFLDVMANRLDNRAIMRIRSICNELRLGGSLNARFTHPIID